MDARLPVSVLLLARDETPRIEALIPALAFAREAVLVRLRLALPLELETRVREIEGRSPRV